MAFSPEEIENKEFLTTLRGYDRDEVRAFLKAVASDVRVSQVEAASSPHAPGDAYESLGQELGQMLKVPKESSDQLKRKAEAEATGMRRRAEEESKSLREAASNAARRLTEEAEQHAIQVRAAADREAAEKTRGAAERLERLQSAETKLRQRLYTIEMVLHSMRDDLESGSKEPSMTR